MRRRAFLAVVGGTASLGTAGCLDGGTAGADEEYDVGMSSTRFEPVRVEVEVGEPLVWRNTNSRAHTVTAYEAQIPDDAEFFASGGYGSEAEARDAYESSLGGAIPSGGTYEYTFSVPGEHPYFCVPHERGGMVGTVVVRE